MSIMSEICVSRRTVTTIEGDPQDDIPEPPDRPSFQPTHMRSRSIPVYVDTGWAERPNGRMIPIIRETGSGGPSHCSSPLSFSSGLSGYSDVILPYHSRSMSPSTGSLSPTGSLGSTGSHNRSYSIDSEQNANLPWNVRKQRIDSALSWIRTELEKLRAQDRVLLSQFQRCQDTIDSIKVQRAAWEEAYRGDECDLLLDEDDEEEDHWEDWEISEFERQFAENEDMTLDLLDRKPLQDRKTLSLKYSETSPDRTRSSSFFRQDLEVKV